MSRIIFPIKNRRDSFNSYCGVPNSPLFYDCRQEEQVRPNLQPQRDRQRVLIRVARPKTRVPEVRPAGIPPSASTVTSSAWEESAAFPPSVRIVRSSAWEELAVSVPVIGDFLIQGMSLGGLIGPVRSSTPHSASSLPPSR